MAWYPKAVRRPITRNFTRKQPRYDAVILHTDAGNARDLYGWWMHPNNTGASSHFHVAKDGTVYQYVDTAHMSWTSGAASSRSIGVETQGYGTEPWTAAQVTALAGLLHWCHTTHGIPLRPMSSSRSTERGIGWHRLGVNGDFPALPSILAGRTQRGGGEVWSKAAGKVCPGTKRIHQIPGIIAAAAGAKAPPPIKTATPEYLGDGKTIWPESPLPATDEHTKDSHNAWVQLMDDAGYSYARLGHQLQAWLDALGHYPMPPYLHDGVLGPVAVKGLQAFLKAKGHYKGLPDGKRGPLTVRAEIAYLNSQRTYYAADQGEADAAKPAPTPTPQEDTLSAAEVKQINAHVTAQADRVIQAIKSHVTADVDRIFTQPAVPWIDSATEERKTFSIPKGIGYLAEYHRRGLAKPEAVEVVEADSTLPTE